MPPFYFMYLHLIGQVWQEMVKGVRRSLVDKVSISIWHLRKACNIGEMNQFGRTYISDFYCLNYNFSQSHFKNSKDFSFGKI